MVFPKLINILNPKCIIKTKFAFLDVNSTLATIHLCSFRDVIFI